MRSKTLFQPSALLTVALVAGLLEVYFSVQFFTTIRPSSVYSWLQNLSLGLEPLHAPKSSGAAVLWDGETVFYRPFTILLGLLSLVGGLLYYSSKFRNDRLLRFGFSVVLGTKALQTVLLGFSTAASLAIAGTVGGSYLLSLVLNLLLCVGWVWYAYWALVTLAQTHTLRTTEVDTETGPQPVLVPADKAQRLVHLLVDTALIVLFVAPAVARFTLLGGALVGSLLTSVVTTVLYFGWYETLLQASPAKFLTGTQVTDANGEPPSLAVVVHRSLCRLIPLEALSFLSSTRDGIHDTWSGTFVVKTE
jgi:uncharacterized RDD family membrane protein YckC